MKRRNLVRILVALPLVAIAGIVWLMYCQMQHEKQNSSLITAIKRDDAPAVLATLNAGADPNAEDMGNVNISFRQILLDWWNNLRGVTPRTNETGREPFTALMLALSPPAGTTPEGTLLANPKIVKALLAKGANPNAIRRTEPPSPGLAFPGTALGLAASNGDTESVRLLLANGANVNLKDKYGLSPLNCALRFNGVADIIVTELLAHGADPNSADNEEGFTPLMLAAWTLDVEKVKALLKAGANANAKTKSGTTALDCARMGASHIHSDDPEDQQVTQTRIIRNFYSLLKQADAKRKQTAGTK